MKTRKIETRFMIGNLDVDGEIFSTLCENYTQSEIFNSLLGSEDVVYSDGFVRAIENGLVPCLDTICESCLPKKDAEYHHFINNDVCYVAYFN